MSFSRQDKTSGMALEDLVRQLPSAVVIVEAASGRILHANARAREMTERQLGRTVPPELTADFEIFHPDGRRYDMDEWPLVRSITSGEEVVDEEYFSLLADGSRLIVRCSSSPMYDDEGRIVAGVLVMNDVTEQRRVEERLAYVSGLLENVEDAVVAGDQGFVLTLWNKGAERLYGWTADEALGREARDAIRLQMSDAERDDMRRRTAAEGRDRRDVVAFRKDGTAVDVELINVAVRDEQGEISGYLGIHRDITERKRAEAERERRANQQALVAELGQRALASHDLQSLLDDAAVLVAGTLDVELAKVGELLPGGEKLLIRAGVGWRKGIVGSETEPVGEGSQAGFTLASDQALLADDLADEHRFTPSPVVREHHAASAITVVIRGRDEPFGILGALSTRPRAFSASDVDFMQAVANVLATAVERSQAQERLIGVREVERRRIARDLHDEALQDVTYALALAGGAATAARVPEATDEMVPALKRIGEQLRGAIYDLRLGGEEHRPFPELLDALLAVHRAMAVGCDIDLDVGAGVPAGPLDATGIEVLRILGEALTNARRHARARHVRVGVWGSGRTLYAEVSDDGRGFDVGSGPPAVDGHGTTGMRERAKLLDGHLDISSDPTTGTRVRLEVPLDQDDLAGVRVLLVEDHATVREAIASAFERDAGFEIVGQAASLAEACGMLEHVDVAVIDLGLPDGYGADLITELHRVNPRAQALVLTATLDHAEIARAIQRGAAGALDKAAHLDDVVDAVRRLRAGEALLPLDEVVELLRFADRQREREHAEREAIAQVTPREQEVLQALAEGLDAQQIADRLHISIRTERNHMANILAKLGVHSQLQALVFALRYDLVAVR